MNEPQTLTEVHAEELDHASHASAQVAAVIVLKAIHRLERAVSTFECRHGRFPLKEQP